ncbi:hypothetical protein [Amycolatopsis sp. NPDC004079]|uniref:hypothetical protein n=1 Tax=Amycolatopsis sp. NPDC004079 TaxID=3154549 RepID=UPI0033ACD2B6
MPTRRAGRTASWSVLAAAARASGSGSGLAYYVGVLFLAGVASHQTVDRHVVLNVMMINAVVQILVQPTRAGSTRIAIVTLVVCALLN